jgi:hypothetical protein
MSTRDRLVVARCCSALGQAVVSRSDAEPVDGLAQG